jgi:V/A-type H+-transporting ATPase subunit E
MNADQVVEKILADANAEASKILRQANDELSRQQAGLDAQLKSFKDETARLAKESAEDKKMRMMAGARMQASREILKTKHVVIETVFAKAAEKILQLDDNSYLSLMEKLLIKAVESGNEQVIVAGGEHRINADFVNRVNGSLGDKGHLSFSGEKCPGRAGFILRHGKIETNSTLDVLLGQAKSELEIKIAKELFQD